MLFKLCHFATYNKPAIQLLLVNMVKLEPLHHTTTPALLTKKKKRRDGWREVGWNHI